MDFFDEKLYNDNTELGQIEYLFFYGARMAIYGYSRLYYYVDCRWSEYLVKVT